MGGDIPADSKIERDSNPLRVTIDGRDVFVDGKPTFNVTIQATVTFEDGEVQEKTFVYDMGRGGLILR